MRATHRKSACVSTLRNIRKCHKLRSVALPGLTRRVADVRLVKQPKENDEIPGVNTQKFCSLRKYPKILKIIPKTLSVSPLKKKLEFFISNFLSPTQINLCMNSKGCETQPRSCGWSFYNDCETNLGICVPVKSSKNPAKQTKCQWRRSPLYTSCLLDP